jgi:hypothetical protein
MSREVRPDAGQPTPDEEGGFLSRWSRRKRDVAAQAGVPPADAVSDVAPPLAPPPAAPDMAAEPALSEAELAEQRQKELDELIASLPKVEEIDASTDVTGFLDARIPDALRNAALRATWISDPTIRDFVNDARDYALDYNTPGMAPGYGALSESDRGHAVEFVKSLFSSRPEPATNSTLVEDRTSPDGEISDQESRAVSQPEIAALHNAAVRDEADASGPEATTGEQSPSPENSGPKPGNSPVLQSTMDELALMPEQAGAMANLAAPAPVRRRGGGALPI